MKGRRVGTLTLGIALVMTGIAYLTAAFAPAAMNLAFLLKLWPVVLVLLGAEVLAAYFINKEERLRYDGWAVFLTFCLIGFAWCLAVVELALGCGGEWGFGPLRLYF